jgi:hypothetical protein
MHRIFTWQNLRDFFCVQLTTDAQSNDDALDDAKIVRRTQTWWVWRLKDGA